MSSSEIKRRKKNLGVEKSIIYDGNNMSTSISLGISYGHELFFIDIRKSCFSEEYTVERGIESFSSSENPSWKSHKMVICGDPRSGVYDHYAEISFVYGKNNNIQCWDWNGELEDSGCEILRIGWHKRECK